MPLIILKGQDDEIDFSFFDINQTGMGPLHKNKFLNLFDLGFEIAEISIIKNHLVICRLHYRNGC